MALSHRGIGDNDPGSSLLSTAFLKTLRWAAIPCLGIALVSWSAVTLAGLHSAASLAYSGPSPLSVEAQLRQLPHQAKPSANARKLLVAPADKSVRIASLSVAQAKPKAAPAVQKPADPFARIVAEAKLSRAKLVAAFAAGGMAIDPADAAEPTDPFASVVAGAKLSREKLHAAFARAGMAIEAANAAETVEVALAMPSAERFHRDAREAKFAALMGDDAAIRSDASDPLSTLALGQIGVKADLAYAAAEASPDSPVQLALASLALDPYGMDDEEPAVGDDIMPDAIELPPEKPDARPARPEARPEAKPGRKPVETADEPAARKPAKPARQEQQQELAYARPDKPEGTVGKAFRNLFNNVPKAGNKVAIYDISAAVVYMPDGSRLEAHSGIGKMADNPRYVHVKMNGPTPPNTYKLSMREKRFHGVEAVRMTPIGNQTMHGRDGILAHSYLLRGGREESHGCVAFANYPKFLKAFKQGKVTHMIVVPSISKAPVRMVSNDRNGA